MKCLVVKASMIDLLKAKKLDPHFYDLDRPNGIKVVARFPPTDEGIANAKQFTKTLTQT